MSKISKLVLIGFVLSIVPVGTVRAAERLIFDEESSRWIDRKEIDKPASGPLAVPKTLYKDARFAKAQSWLKKYLKGSPDDATRPDAMVLYADCAFALGKYFKANERYQRVIDEYPHTLQFAIALRRQLDIAKAWLDGRKRRIWFFKLSAEDEGLDLLSRVEQLGAGHRIAEVALRATADYYYRTGQFDLAQFAYGRLITDYGSRRYTRSSMARAAASALAAFPGVKFDGSALLEAKELYGAYMERFPDEAKREDIRTILKQIALKRAEKEFEVGRFYVHIRKPMAAAHYFNYVMATWPETLWADRARGQMLRLGFEPGVPLDDGVEW